MKLSKIKIDKSDLKLIFSFVKQLALKFWRGNTKMEIAYFQIVRALSVYTKQRTMLKKRLHGESVLGNPSKYLVRSIKQSLRHLQKEMKSLEEKFIKVY